MYFQSASQSLDLKNTEWKIEYLMDSSEKKEIQMAGTKRKSITVLSVLYVVNLLRYYDIKY